MSEIKRRLAIYHGRLDRLGSLTLLIEGKKRLLCEVVDVAGFQVAFFSDNVVIIVCDITACRQM